MFYLYEFRRAIITFHKNSFCISFKVCEHKKTDHSCNVSWQATVFRLRIWGYNYIPSEITNCYASSQKLLLILLQMKKEGIIVKLVLWKGRGPHKYTWFFFLFHITKRSICYEVGGYFLEAVRNFLNITHI